MRFGKLAGTVALTAAVALALVASGCATKKYVQQTVAPIQQKVGDLDKKTTEHGSSIGELEKGVSRADERALSADSRATAAASEAARAKEQAAMASKGADEAKTLAEKGVNRAGEVERDMTARIENADNFKLVSTESILFGFGQCDLNKDAKEQLDGAAGKIAGMKHFVIEVQGFTDKTGSADYNLELSRKRAAAVVRYLTVNHKVPLHRIHTLGFGSEAPAADNKTRDGRKQNRRVEVRTYAPGTGAA